MDTVVAEGRRVFEEAQESMERDAATQAQQAEAALGTRRTAANDAVTRSSATATRLVCPSCRRPLDFESTYIAGTGRDVDRWDRLVCNGGGCGDFEYRHRTRTLRPAS